MTKDSDFKRLVRARAARAGESYQTARLQLRPDDNEATARPRADVAEEFARSGIVKLTDVFSEESAAAMRDAVWQGWSDAYGVVREDASTWERAERGRS